MEILIGDFVIEPIHILIFFIIIALIVFVIWLMSRQKVALQQAQRETIAKVAGAEVPRESVDIEALDIVIKPENEGEVEQFSQQRYLIFTKPNTPISLNIAINGNPVAQMMPGFFEYSFEQPGENILTVSLAEKPGIFKEIKITVSELDYSKVQLSLSKDDGGYQTTVGSNDSYSIALYPNYPLAINIYVDDQYYTQVTGSTSFQYYFNEPGTHTFYAVLDADHSMYTEYVSVQVVEETNEEYTSGEEG